MGLIRRQSPSSRGEAIQMDRLLFTITPPPFSSLESFLLSAVTHLNICIRHDSNNLGPHTYGPKPPNTRAPVVACLKVFRIQYQEELMRIPVANTSEYSFTADTPRTCHIISVHHNGPKFMPEVRGVPLPHLTSRVLSPPFLKQEQSEYTILKIWMSGGGSRRWGQNDKFVPLQGVYHLYDIAPFLINICAGNLLLIFITSGWSTWRYPYCKFGEIICAQARLALPLHAPLSWNHSPPRVHVNALETLPPEIIYSYKNRKLYLPTLRPRSWWVSPAWNKDNYAALTRTWWTGFVYRTAVDSLSASNSASNYYGTRRLIYTLSCLRSFAHSYIMVVEMTGCDIFLITPCTLLRQSYTCLRALVQHLRYLGYPPITLVLNESLPDGAHYNF